MAGSFSPFCQPSLSSDGRFWLHEILFVSSWEYFLYYPSHLEVFYLFSSMGFKVSDCTFRSLTHCILICVQSERYGLNFIPLQGSTLFLQRLLLKSMSFFTNVYFWHPYLWGYCCVGLLLGLYYISLIHTSVFQTCRHLQLIL